MNTITLPDDLPLDHSQAVQVFDYQSAKEIAKQQIALNRNTFSFLTEGTKEVVFDNSALAIDNSQFLIMKSGHCLMTERLSGNRNYSSVLLFFSNETVMQFLRKNGLTVNGASGYPSVHSFRYDEFIQRFVSSLLDIAKLSKVTQKKLIEVKLEEILLYLTEIHGTGFLHALTANSDNATQKFIRTVEMNQWNKLTVNELAFLCNKSVSSFKREFEKHYGESPIKWFQNKRLEKAYHLLHQEHKNASEIYFEVGYENLSSFIQAYKSKYGVTPKQHHKS
ncbi:AraC family transcriptional regulator [Flavobacterium amniphilum]|uniref:helix-turn-helix domain-containing protein n=1 Tax=Flavobacterium amniphilum TaxID=1834035 RepID=UPI00202A46DD|nr:AraC family transcriptional regulator [Flavobacterium amniphilum]MCL9807518.1 AraC family transcriptional regulator [Flavobacterium amniphilum]